MNLLKRLAINGGVLLSILGGAKATPIFNPTNPFINPISLSGRFSFDYLGYSNFAKPGDEIGFFRGEECIGSSNLINPFGYYNDLKINPDSINYILNKIPSVNVKAFNLETNSLWNVKVMGYNSIAKTLDFQANEKIGYVPEPATIALFGAGLASLYLISSFKKKR